MTGVFTDHEGHVGTQIMTMNSDSQAGGDNAKQVKFIRADVQNKTKAITQKQRGIGNP